MSSENFAKEDIVPCARILIQKAMHRPWREGQRPQDNFSDRIAEEVETAIFAAAKTTTQYIVMVVKFVLHISQYTHIGRTSYSFHDMIFDSSMDMDTIVSLDEERWFPELFANPYLGEGEKRAVRKTMEIEHSSLRRGFESVISKCCRADKCEFSQINDSYGTEFFSLGTDFEHALSRVCTINQTDYFAPPKEEITIFERSVIRGMGGVLAITCIGFTDLMTLLAEKEKGITNPSTGEVFDEALELDLRTKYKSQISMRKFYLESLS